MILHVRTMVRSRKIAWDFWEYFKQTSGFGEVVQKLLWINIYIYNNNTIYIYIQSTYSMQYAVTLPKSQRNFNTPNLEVPSICFGPCKAWISGNQSWKYGRQYQVLSYMFFLRHSWNCSFNLTQVILYTYTAYTFLLVDQIWSVIQAVKASPWDSFLCSALWKTTQTELINGNVYVLYVFAALLYGLNSNSWCKHGILAILRWSIAKYLRWLDSLGLDSTISSNVSQSQRV